jgi:S-adenosyl-L-methionine hydrolase (adenosine-forming)
MKFITILTDFGLQDGFVGVMKAIILGIAPEARIADVCHLIEAQNVLQGAFVLGRTVPYFPSGTIHIAVVDPGVGTARRPIAVRLRLVENGQPVTHFLVGPDNGLFTYLYQRAESQLLPGSPSPIETVHLDRPEYWRDEISAVFHGRDIFAPVAAHLANGTLLDRLGTPILDEIRLPIPAVERSEGEARGQVVLIDSFGNLLTNLERRHLAALGAVRVRLRGVEIDGISPTFGSRPVGELAAVYGEEADLTIAVVNGSAQAQLGAQVGDPVQVVRA